VFASDDEFRRALEREPILAGVIGRAGERRFQALARWSGPDGTGEVGFRADAEYFYPASTAKAVQALAACEKLATLRARGPANDAETISLDTPIVYGEETQSFTLREDLRRALIVSDNPAANRLLDFVGFDELHERAARWGLASLAVRHALSEVRTPTTMTRRVRLAEGAEIEPERVGLIRARENVPGLLVGRGFARPGGIEMGPADFALKNRVTLADLCTLMELILSPERFPPARRPDLGPAERAELLRAMSARPGECRSPALELPAGGEDDLRPLARGLAAGRGEGRSADVRVIEKIGQAYGFTTSAAAFEREGVVVSLAATIETNANGILNDDAYEYRELGEPAIEAVGRLVGRSLLARED
jgi:hypothetical protein